MLLNLRRAPGLDIYEFHSQGKSERERVLAKLRRRGGVCLTSYGIVVNCAEQLATKADGQDFTWVRKKLAILIKKVFFMEFQFYIEHKFLTTHQT